MSDEHPPHVDNTPHDDHEPAAYDDLGIRSIVLVGGIGAVLVFVAVVAVQVVYFRYEDREFQRKVLDVPLAKTDAILEEQRQYLATAGEAQTGDRRIPIDKAIDLIVAEYEAKRAAQQTDSKQPAADAAEKADDENAAADDSTPDEEPADENSEADETSESEANSTQP